MSDSTGHKSDRLVVERPRRRQLTIGKKVSHAIAATVEHQQVSGFSSKDLQDISELSWPVATPTKGPDVFPVKAEDPDDIASVGDRDQVGASERDSPNCIEQLRRVAVKYSE